MKAKTSQHREPVNIKTSHSQDKRPTRQITKQSQDNPKTINHEIEYIDEPACPTCVSRINLRPFYETGDETRTKTTRQENTTPRKENTNKQDKIRKG